MTTSAAWDEWKQSGVRPAADQTGLQDWIDAVLPQGEFRSPSPPIVASIVPSIYEAYVRIFHPITSPLTQTPVRWMDLATQHGLPLSSSVRFEDLQGHGVRDASGHQIAPLVGTLAANQSESLILALGQPTSEVVFGFWVGLSAIRDVWPAPPSRGDGGDVRECVFFEGPLKAVGALWLAPDVYVSPTYWFPKGDRTWFVTSHPDYTSTYLGCTEDTQSLATAMHGSLEAIAVDPEEEAIP